MGQVILIIDDSKSIHGLVRARLANEPVECHSAENGTEGLASAQRLLPDLILLDVDMPQPDGFEVCRQLKADALTREIPVIFLTGASSTDEKLKGLQLGAIDYITKPFEPAELRARVKAALRNKELLDLLHEKATVLEVSEQRFRFLAEHSSDMISRHDPAGAFLYASPACRLLLGYESDELVGRDVSPLLHPADADRFHNTFRALRSLDDTCTITFRARRKDGTAVWLESTLRAVTRGGGGESEELLEIHMSSRDVTLRKEEETLEQCRAEVLQMIAENRPLAEVLQRLVGMVEQEHPGTFASVVLLAEGRLEHVAPNLPPAFRAALDRHLLRLASDVCSDAASAGQSVARSDIATDPRWVNIRDAARADGVSTCRSILIRSGTGDVRGMFAIFHGGPPRPDRAADPLLETAGRLLAIATDHRELTHQLDYRAHHDSLTGLPNRLLFEDRLLQSTARAARNRHLTALFYIDLDRFKLINDTLGHHAGDALLVQFSRRVVSLLSETDTLARMGGDEFALILPEIHHKKEAVELAARLVGCLKEPFELSGQELFVTGSVGVAVYPFDAPDAATLQKHADAAMYHAKELGRNGYQCFTPDMLSASSERMQMETQLRRAVEQNALALHYQGQFDRDERLVGVEALVRWNHPKLGLVGPSQFIPLAEETGLILGIGAWVLDEACRQNKQWQRDGLPPIRVAVNVSALQFTQPDFPELVIDTLRRHDLAPEHLELEITETLLMNNTQQTAEKLDRLRRAGVGVALDDFGTGYSSLAYLQRLPIDTLKIDRSFVREITADTDLVNNTVVIRAIVSLGRTLGMSLLAEGVETPRQRDFLRQIGCNGMQGFLFGRPRTPDEIASTLSRLRQLPPLPLSA